MLGQQDSTFAFSIVTIFLVIVPVGRAVQAQVLDQDLQALAALYHATNGPGWNDRTNWLSGPASSWHGVTVTEGRVTELSLGFNQLSGEIPPELSKLSKLQVLDLSFNQLSGSIPAQLGSLDRLEI